MSMYIATPLVYMYMYMYCISVAIIGCDGCDGWLCVE